MPAYLAGVKVGRVHLHMLGGR